MKRLFLLCFFIILTACGPCIEPGAHINGKKTIINTVICTNPSWENNSKLLGCNNDECRFDCQKPINFNASDPKTYWVDSGIVLGSGDKMELVVTPWNVEVCAGCPDICDDEKGSCNTEFCKILRVEAGKGDNSPIDMVFNDGDTISFSLKPRLELGKITESICNGEESMIYAGDPTECKKNYLGKYYSAVVGNSKDASANVLKNYVDNSWIESNVLYSIDSAKVLKEVWDIGSASNYDFCQFLRENPNDTASLDIKNKVDSFTLNQFCENIKMYQYDDKLQEREVRGNNYTIFPIAKKHHDYNEYLSYILDLDVAELHGPSGVYNIYSSASNERIPAIDGMPATKLNKEFIINSKNDTGYNKVKLDLNNEWKQPGKGGGYTFKISRRCPKEAGQILYMYIGDEAPNFKPGEAGSTLIGPIDLSKEENVIRNINIEEGKVFFGIKAKKEGGYSTHTGYFDIRAEIKADKNPIPILSSVVTSVRNQILRILYGNNSIDSDTGMTNDTFLNSPEGAVGTVYKAVLNSAMLNAVRAMILLYIMIRGILFLIGSLRTPQLEFVVSIVKIGIVAVLLSDNSWRFFNEYLFKLFIDGSTYLINIMSNASSPDEKVTDFEFLDRIFSRFTQPNTWLQLFSLLVAFPVGWMFLLAILWGLFEIFKAIVSAVISYFMSIVLVAILICIAPIFISFLLFKRTKAIFDSWIKNLAQIVVVPSMIFASIALLSNVVIALIHALFNFSICTRCAINLILDIKIDQYPICILYAYMPNGYDPEVNLSDYINNHVVDYGFYGLPVSISALIAFIVLAHAISGFVHQGTAIAVGIFGAPGADISAPATQFQDSMKSIVGADAQAIGQRVQQAYEGKLDGKKELSESTPKGKS